MLDRLRLLLPIELEVIGPLERRVWPPSLLPLTSAFHPDTTDTGVVQSDDVTVDLEGTRAKLEQWLRERESIVAREAARLEGRFDLVVGDVPALAFEASTRAGIRSVAIANFSWDWIYSALGFDEAAAAAARAYAETDLLLETIPNAPMESFRRRLNVGLVAREPSQRRDETRASLGVGTESLVLVAFQASSAPELRLPPMRPGRRYVVPASWPGDDLRGDVIQLDASTRFEDAIAAADVVLGKPGYGLIGDVEASGARFLYVARPGFPENEVLERHLASRAATAPLPSARLAAGDWDDVLSALEETARPEAADARGAERAASAIASMLDVDTVPGAD